MPSLRKVIEDLEYNKLPSPTRANFATAAAAATAATNKVAVTLKHVNGDAKGKQAVSTERLAFDDPAKSAEEKGSSELNGRKPIAKTRRPSLSKKQCQNDIVEILSDDDEEISLHDLAKLRENGIDATTTATKTVEKVIARSFEKDVYNSVSTFTKTSLSAANHVPKKAEKSQPAASTGNMLLVAKAGVNSGGTTSPHAMETNIDPSATNSSVARAPLTNQNPLAATTSTANRSSEVSKPQRPYSSNPTVQKNATAVLQNIRNNLNNSMPTQQKVCQNSLLGPTATMPDMERWSEYRIDSAASIDDLESIRRRLLSLTDRVNLRLKEMRFIEAIAMTETHEGFVKRESIEEMIRSWADNLELYSSDTTKSRDDSSTQKNNKRELADNDTGELEKNATNAKPCKRQRSSCCPFCLNTTAAPDDEAYSTCSVCDETSYICLRCRVYCNDCHRLTCEDCLMMCDTCFSGPCCTDCMAKTGRCASCSKVKPKTSAKLSPAARPNGKLQPHVLKSSEKEALPLTSQTGASNYSIHRFVITEKRALGLTITDNKSIGTASIRHVQDKSVAEYIGLRSSDQICLPFTNGAQPSNSYDLFIQASQLRPLILEVKRKISHPQIGRILHRFHITDEGHLGMSVKAVNCPGGHCTIIVSIQPGSLGDIHGICRGDIICKPFTNGAAYINVYSWFMGVVKQRPLTFEVWRDRSSFPTTNCQANNLLKKSANPFLWHFGRTTINNVNDGMHLGLSASVTK
eukprot:CCRYP_000711-RA/>CCRYP_000711-RA protein AED:0.01 eAED:0.01 QI:286/1/1/1/0/0/2/1294/746